MDEAAIPNQFAVLYCEMVLSTRLIYWVDFGYGIKGTWSFWVSRE